MLLLLLLVACRCGLDVYGGGPVDVAWLDADGTEVGAGLVFPAYDEQAYAALAAAGFDAVRADASATARDGERGALLFTPLGDADAAWIEGFGGTAGSFAPELGGDCTAAVAWGALTLYRRFDGQDGLVLELGDEGYEHPRVRVSWQAPEQCTGDSFAGTCEGPVEAEAATCAEDLPPGSRLRVSWSFDEDTRVREQGSCVDVY